MKLEEEIREQLKEENLPEDGKDAELYMVLFKSLGKERQSILSNDFEDKVISQLRQPLFTWREVAVFSLLIFMPVFGLIYFSELAVQVMRLPIISWLANNVISIVYGLILLLGIQLSDHYIKRHLSH